MEGEVLSLADCESVMYITTRVDIGGQGTLHRHAKDVLFLCDRGIAVTAVQLGEILEVKEKWV